jgi:ubiquinone/menaquinone biosynthesis C-methylase UbiE
MAHDNVPMSMKVRPATRLAKPIPCPAIVPGSPRSVLDVGCGAGVIGEALDLDPSALACGLDIDMNALEHGRASGAKLRFVCGNGERLPFAARSFDYVVCGVALPYMNIPRALTEMRRVLRPGGYLWASLHPLPFALHDFGRALRMLSWKNLIFRPYVLTNGCTFHLTGRMFRFPLQRKRCESFQTVRSMRLALRHADFEVVEAKRWQWYFTVLAKAPQD